MTFQGAREELSQLIVLFPEPEHDKRRQALFMAMESLSGFADIEARIIQSRLQSPAGDLKGVKP